MPAKQPQQQFSSFSSMTGAVRAQPVLHSTDVFDDDRVRYLVVVHALWVTAGALEYGSIRHVNWPSMVASCAPVAAAVGCT